MADFIDLIRIGRDDPKYLRSVLADKEKITKFKLTSAELDALKKLDPDTIRVVVDRLEERLRIRPAASSQACTDGTNACVGRRVSAAPEMIPKMPLRE